MKFIISIAGGGMRGVIPLVFLQLLEEELGSLSDKVDLVGGTSTGGILSCLLADGNGMDVVENFYRREGPRIFKSNIFQKAQQLLRPKYNLEVLQESLRRTLGGRPLKTLKVHTMLTSATTSRHEVMIKSWTDRWAELPLFIAGSMTCAAPTYFREASWGSEFYVDGGLVRNNPCACVALESFLLWPEEEIFHLALGTGTEHEDRRFPHNGGVLQWGPQIFDGMSQLDSRYDHYTCSAYGRINKRYWYLPIDCPFPKLPSLDNYSSKSLDYMMATARSNFEEPAKYVVSILGSSKSPYPETSAWS